MLVQRQLRTAETAELRLQVQPRQRQCRHAPGGQQQVQASAAVFDQPQHQLVDDAAAEPVVIVDNHADAPWRRAQRADQHRHRLARILVAVVQHCGA